MKTASQITSDFSKAKLAVLFVLFLLSGVKMAAQQASAVSSAPRSEITVATDDNTISPVAAANATESNSNINIVSWFMGSKQTPKADTSDSILNSKKQMINSGIAPNRLLIKTLLKKAASFQSNIA